MGAKANRDYLINVKMSGAEQVEAEASRINSIIKELVDGKKIIDIDISGVNVNHLFDKINKTHPEILAGVKFDYKTNQLANEKKRLQDALAIEDAIKKQDAGSLIKAKVNEINSLVSNGIDKKLIAEKIKDALNIAEYFNENDVEIPSAIEDQLWDLETKFHKQIGDSFEVAPIFEDANKYIAESKKNISLLETELEELKKNLPSIGGIVDDDISNSSQAVDELRNKINEIVSGLSKKSKVTIFDGVNTEVLDTIDDCDKLKEKLYEVISAMDLKNVGFHRGNLSPEILSSSGYAPGENLNDVMRNFTTTHLQTGLYTTSYYKDLLNWTQSHHALNQQRYYLTDLGKAGNLLTPPSDKYLERLETVMNAFNAMTIHPIMPKGLEAEYLVSGLAKDFPTPEVLYDIFKDIFDDLKLTVSDISSVMESEREKLKYQFFDESVPKSAKTKIPVPFNALLERAGYYGINANMVGSTDSTWLGSVMHRIDTEHPFSIDFGHDTELYSKIGEMLYKEILNQIKIPNKNNELKDLEHLSKPYMMFSELKSLYEKSNYKPTFSDLNTPDIVDKSLLDKQNQQFAERDNDLLNKKIQQLKEIQDLMNTIAGMQVESAYSQRLDEEGTAQYMHQLIGEIRQTQNEITDLQVDSNGMPTDDVQRRIDLLEVLKKKTYEAFHSSYYGGSDADKGAFNDKWDLDTGYLNDLRYVSIDEVYSKYQTQTLAMFKELKSIDPNWLDPYAKSILDSSEDYFLRIQDIIRRIKESGEEAAGAFHDKLLDRYIEGSKGRASWQDDVYDYGYDDFEEVDEDEFKDGVSIIEAETTALKGATEARKEYNQVVKETPDTSGQNLEGIDIGADVAKSFDDAADAKARFASANQKASDSADQTGPSVNREAQAAQEAKSAFDDATKAKEEFAKANQETADSAEQTGSAIDRSVKAAHEIEKAFKDAAHAQDAFTKLPETLNENVDAIQQTIDNIQKITATGFANILNDISSKEKELTDGIAEHILSQIGKIPEDLNKISTQAMNLGSELTKLGLSNSAISGSAEFAQNLKDAAEALNNISSGFTGRSGELVDTFRGWRAGDHSHAAAYSNSESPVPERSLLIGKDSKIYGQYSFGRKGEVRGKVFSKIVDDVAGEILAEFHSHSGDPFVGPSLDNGDMSSWIRQFIYESDRAADYGGIVGDMQIGLFNTAKFVEDYKDTIVQNLDGALIDLESALDNLRDETKENEFIPEIIDKFGGGFDKAVKDYFIDNFGGEAIIRLMDQDAPIDMDMKPGKPVEIPYKDYRVETDLNKLAINYRKNLTDFSQDIGEGFQNAILESVKLIDVDTGKDVTKFIGSNLFDQNGFFQKLEDAWNVFQIGPSFEEELYKYTDLPEFFNHNERATFSYAYSKLFPQAVQKAWGISPEDFSKYWKTYTYDEFEKENPLNLPDNKLQAFLSAKNGSGDNPALFDTEQLNGVKASVDAIATSLSELLSIYKELNNVGNDFFYESLAPKVFDMQKITDALKEYHETGYSDNLAEYSDEELDALQPLAAVNYDEFLRKWAMNLATDVESKWKLNDRFRLPEELVGQEVSEVTDFLPDTSSFDTTGVIEHVKELIGILQTLFEVIAQINETGLKLDIGTSDLEFGFKNAADAKEQFANANKEVADSADATTIATNGESDAASTAAESFDAAQKSKELFADANKNVADSADETASAIGGPDIPPVKIKVEPDADYFKGSLDSIIQSVSPVDISADIKPDGILDAFVDVVDAVSPMKIEVTPVVDGFIDKIASAVDGKAVDIKVKGGGADKNKTSGKETSEKDFEDFKYKKEDKQYSLDSFIKNQQKAIEKSKELSKAVEDLKEKLSKSTPETGFRDFDRYFTRTKDQAKEVNKQIKEEEKQAAKDKKAAEKEAQKRASQVEKFNGAKENRQIVLDSFIESSNDAINSSSALQESVENLKKTLSDSTVDTGLDGFDKAFEKVQKDVSNFNKMTKSFEGAQKYISGFLFDEKGDPVKQTGEVAEKLKEAKEILSSIGEANKLDITNKDDIAQLEKLLQLIDEIKTSLKQNSNEFKIADPTTVKKLNTQMANFVNKNSRLTKEFTDQIDELRQKLNDPKLTNNELKQVVVDFNQLMSDAMDQGLVGGKGIFENLFHRIGQMNTNFFAMFFSMYDIIRYVREITSVVTEFDTALTEMRKVSDVPVEILKNYQRESFDIASEIGTTALQLQTSTADFMRLGEGLEEAAESAKQATVLMNVSEFDSIADATDALIAMSYAYKDVTKENIVDKMNELGNNYAISTDGIASALQRSASALVTAGNDIDQAAALVTAGNTILQDPEKVGNGLRVIALRLTGTKEAGEELQEMGEDVDGFLDTQSKLRDTIMDATKVASNGYKGFDILDDNGNYKSTYDIMLGISEIYDEIVATDKKFGTNHMNLLLETMAGKNRANIAASILQNGDVLRNAYQSSLQAEGSAEKENQKYLDSIEGRIQLFKNALNELETVFVNSDLIKSVISFGTEFLKVITSITEATNGIAPTLAAAFGAFAVGGAKLTNAKSVPDFIRKLFGKKTIQEEVSDIAKEIDRSNATDFLQDLQSAAGAAGDAVDGVGGSILKTSSDAGVGASRIAKLITAFKGLSTAAKVGIGVGAVAAVTGVAYGIYRQHKENLHNQASEATGNWEQQKKSLQEYIDQYSQLKKKLDEGNLSESETVSVKQQILAIQTEIASKYGDQVGSIDLVNGHLGTQLEILKQITQEQARQNIIDNRKAYEDAEKEMTGNYYAVYNGEVGNGDIKNRILKAAEDAGLTISGGQAGLPYNIYYDGDADDAKANIGHFISDLEAMKIDYPDNSFINNIIGLSDVSYQKAKATTDKYLSDYRSYLEQQIFESGKGYELINYSQAVDNYNNALATGTTEEIKEAAEAFRIADEQKQQFLDTSNVDYSPIFDQITEGLNQSAVEIQAFRDKLGESSVANILKNQKMSRTDFEAALASGSSSIARTLGWQFGLTTEDMSQLTPQAKQFVDVLVDMGYVLADATDEVGKLDAGIVDFALSATKAINAIDTVNGAIVNSFSGTGLSAIWDEEAGTISGDIATIIDAYQNLEGYNPERLFQNTATGIHLNVDELNKLRSEQDKIQRAKFASKEADLQKKLAKAIEDKNLAMRSGSEYDDGRINDLANQLNQVQELSAAYNGATSAYQKWIQAQSGGERGDVYDNITSTALSRAKELYEAGLVGTNEFRALANLFSFEDLSTAPIDQLTASFKEAYPIMEQFFTEGTKGVNKFLDELVANKFATEENGMVNVLPNSMEEMAKKLQISEEAVEIIFQKLEDFGFHVEFFDPVIQGQIDGFNQSISETQEKLASLHDPRIDLNIDFDAEQLNDLDDIQSRIKGLESLKAMPGIDGTMAEQQIEILIADLQAKWDALNGYTASPGISYKTVSQANNAYANLQEMIQTMSGVNGITIETIMNDSDITSVAEELSKLDNDIKISLGIDVDATPEDIIKQIAGDYGIDVSIMPHIEEGSVEAQIPDDVKLGVDAEVDKSQILAVTKQRYIAKFNAQIVNKTELQNQTGTIRYTAVYPKIEGSNYAPWNNRWQGTANSGGTAWDVYKAYAHGNWGADESETALVNELGPEIIVRGSEWFLANNGLPGFTNIKKGDIIFNAKQSEDLLRKGKTGSYARAYASGTAYADSSVTGAGPQPRPKENTLTSAAKAASSAAKSSSKASKASKDAAEEAKNILDEIQILLDRTQRLVDAADKIVQNTAELYKTRHSQITEELSHLDDLIKYNQQGYDRYIQEANSVGLDEEWASKVREGRIDIEKIDDDDLWQKIQDYQQWWIRATMHGDMYVKNF